MNASLSPQSGSLESGSLQPGSLESGESLHLRGKASAGDSQVSLRNKGRKEERKERLTAWIMLSPSLVGVGLFLIVPVVLVLAFSFTDWNLISSPSYVGVENYTHIFSSTSFRQSIAVTLIFSLISIPCAIFLGLIIAVALNRKLPGSRFFQVLYVVPWVCAPLALGVVWQWILDPRNGLITSLFHSNIALMSNPALALPTVAFVYVWQNIGYISLFFLAGLQGIPHSIIEAARLDGAGPVRMLWKIYLPLVRPTMFFVAVTSTISSFQAFDLVMGLTGGNLGYPSGTTNVIAAQIYTTAFGTSNNIGRACAMAVVLLAIVVVGTLLQQRYFSKRMVYELA